MTIIYPSRESDIRKFNKQVEHDVKKASQLPVHKPEFERIVYTPADKLSAALRATKSIDYLKKHVKK